LNERLERWLTVAAALVGLAGLAWQGATRGIATALGDLSFAILSFAALLLLAWAGTASARRWRILAALAFILIMSVALHPHDWARGMMNFYNRD
jgi:Mg2+/Co2+ transporter CorB